MENGQLDDDDTSDESNKAAIATTKKKKPERELIARKKDHLNIVFIGHVGKKTVFVVSLIEL